VDDFGARGAGEEGELFEGIFGGGGVEGDEDRAFLPLFGGFDLVNGGNAP